jgi:uncharacterized membrane protein YbhN (UPF0104 family)
VTTLPALLGRLFGRRPPTWSLVGLGVAVTVLAAASVATTVDRDALQRAVQAALGDPGGWVLLVAALGGAFTLRALAWRQVLPGVPLGQALAAIHLSLGANHVLPLRLGEGARVASVLRRTDLPAAPVTASAVALRVADVLALVAVGIVAAPAAFSRLLGPWGAMAAGLLAVVAAGAWLWLGRLSRAGRDVARPGWRALALTAGAWLLEAVAVWQALRWSGIDVTPRGALLVTAAAVTAQVAAVAPSGFGTYEVAAVAALATLGHSPGTALAAALTTHAAKTAYSLGTGAVALVAPRPGLLRRTRQGPALAEPDPGANVEVAIS